MGYLSSFAKYTMSFGDDVAARNSVSIVAEMAASGASTSVARHWKETPRRKKSARRFRCSKDTVAVMRRVLGPQHPETQRMQENLEIYREEFPTTA